MVIFRMRGTSDSKEVLRKLKRMHNFTKELIECVEDDEIDFEDDDEEYRYSERGRMMERGRGRYRRSM